MQVTGQTIGTKTRVNDASAEKNTSLKIDFLCAAAGFEQSYAIHKAKKMKLIFDYLIVSFGLKEPVNYERFNLAEHQSSISEKACKLLGKLLEQKLLENRCNWFLKIMQPSKQ